MSLTVLPTYGKKKISVSKIPGSLNLKFTFQFDHTSTRVHSFVVAFSELSVSLVDEALSTVVSRNVAKAIRLFSLKCEQSLITGGEASQVIDSPTPGQQSNVAIANLLHYLSSQTSRVVANLSGSLAPEGASFITEALAGIDELTKNIISPILASMSDAIESIILTMHDDPEFKESVHA